MSWETNVVLFLQIVFLCPAKRLKSYPQKKVEEGYSALVFHELNVKGVTSLALVCTNRKEQSTVEGPKPYQASFFPLANSRENRRNCFLESHWDFLTLKRRIHTSVHKTSDQTLWLEQDELAWLYCSLFYLVSQMLHFHKMKILR